MEKRLQTFIKRELRALGDVEIVSLEEEWHYLFQFAILELTFKADGTKTGYVSIAGSVSKVVPKYHFIRYDYQDFRPVYPPIIIGGYQHVDGLLEYAIEEVGRFDKHLAQFRKK